MTEYGRGPGARDRSWAHALEAGGGDPNAATLHVLRTSIAVHREWLAYAEESGDHAAGSPRFHRECIEAYEHMVVAVETLCRAAGASP